VLFNARSGDREGKDMDVESELEPIVDLESIPDQDPQPDAEDDYASMLAHESRADPPGELTNHHGQGMSDEPNACVPQMIDEPGVGAALVTTFQTSGGGGAGGADAGDAGGAGGGDVAASAELGLHALVRSSSNRDQRLSLSEILGYIRRKEPWEIKPEDARLLLESRLAEGGALEVPSLKYANWVHKSEPHVFFVEGEDMGDIGESDYERVITSGALSHAVNKFADLIAVKRASCSPGKDTPNPKKVGEWQLALLEGHPYYESDNFRGKKLKEEREYGRGETKSKLRLFGPKLVHSVLDKKRKADAGSSSVENNVIPGDLRVDGSVHIGEKLTVGQDGEGLIHGRLQGHQADHAEWMPRHDPGEVLMPGDVVALTRDADGTQIKVSKRAMGFVDSADVEWVVVPTNPQILGHQPPPGEEHLHVPIVFMGQVPVRVEGSPRASRYLMPSDRLCVCR
jgi:hypothetical protein